MKKFTRPLLLASLLALVCAWTLPETASTALFHYEISSIESFTWKKGEDSWSEMAQKRLENTELIFHETGMFTFQFPWDSNNSYLIDGTFKKHKNGSYTFRAFEATSSGLNGNHILVTGALYFKEGLPAATIHFASGNHTGTSINDVKFKELAKKMYSAKVSLH